jgi:hypothetical protein
MSHRHAIRSCNEGRAHRLWCASKPGKLSKTQRARDGAPYRRRTRRSGDTARCRRCAFTALLVLLFCLVSSFGAPADNKNELRVGRAGHAFDHLGSISMQGEAAATSGATIIYASGLGAEGYQGLPSPEKLMKAKKAAAEYVRRVKAFGIRLAIGYVCATSIVKLETFDKEWPPQFRPDFHTPPAEWRQQGRDGKPLPSWYGGDYQPACMNHPDWRAYEKFIVRQQIESGHDGIFFDNPTVHPQGCYCAHCMEKFSSFLNREKVAIADLSLEGLRRVAVERKPDFLRFRCTIAREFLADMRAYARTLNREALVTCNNSLNSPDAFYSQCRDYGYNISEMSQAEDYVVVEDMGHQPRILPSGQVMEYGPTYRMLHAIAHGKPIVAVTIAEGDYHTSPNLTRLAMAEAAANNASYVSWPTWPEKQRPSMIAALRPQADLLSQQEPVLNETRARQDVVLFLPFRRWLETNRCIPGDLAAELSRANIQFEVLSEDQFDLAHLKSSPRPPVLLIESRSVLTKTETETVKKFEHAGGGVIAAAENQNWLAATRQSCDPSFTLTGPPTVRAVVRDQPKRTIVHLLNLNIERISSIEDKIHPAENLRIVCRVPLARVRSVWAVTADPGGTSNGLEFSAKPLGKEMVVETMVSRVEIATILVIEP